MKNNIGSRIIPAVQAAFKVLFLFFCVSFSGVQLLFGQMPSGIPSLKLWLRPDTLITTNLVDTSIISWKNIIDTNLVFTSPPSQPSILPPHVRYNTAALNNHSVVRFDASILNGLESQAQLSLNNNPITMLMFVKINSAAFYGHLFCYGAGGGSDLNLRLVGNSGRLSFIIGGVSSDGAGVHGGVPGGNTSNLALTPNFTFVSGFEDQNIPGGNFFINENCETKDTSIHLNMTIVPNTVTLGYRADVPNILFGDFDAAEIMIFDSTLTNSQLTDLNSYFQQRYSQFVNLGADISNSNLCPDTLDAGSYFSSFLWSNGDTTQTTIINSPGIYYVTATDMYCFSSTDTIIVTYPTIAPPSTNILCLGDSLLWNTNLSSPFTFLWSTSETTDSIYMHNSGPYTVTVTDALGCTKSMSINVVVDSFSVIASLGPDDTLCAGNTIQLMAGASQAQSYLWSPGGETTSSIVVTSPGGLYILDVIDTNGCPATDTINIFIQGNAPTASFLPPFVCEGATMYFSDSTSYSNDASTISGWSWTFGDTAVAPNDTATQQFPFYNYPAVGTYPVTLIVTTSSGCSDDTTINVNVYPLPIVNFGASASCSGTPTYFTDSTDTSGYAVTRLWDFGDPLSGSNTSTAKNPTHVYDSAGVYTVVLTVTNIHGCSASFSSLVTVNASAQVWFSNSVTCIGQTMYFYPNIQGSFSSVFWNFGDASTGSTSPGPVVPHNYAYAGNDTVTLSVLSTNGCISSYSIVVTVNERPNANFLTTSACEATSYNFVDSSWISSGSVTGWRWTFPGGVTDTTQTPSFVFSDTLIYPVTLIAISGSGCKDTITRNIKVYPLPNATFGFTPLYGDAPLLEVFTNFSTGAQTYLWDFGDTTGTDTSANPLHTYLNRGLHTVMLIATSSHGCVDTAYRYVYVVKPLLDLAVLSVSKISGSNYLRVSAKLGNLGTRDITSFKISATLENSLPVFENWTGMFTAGGAGDTTYNFTGQFEISKDNPPSYLCVEATEPNNETDDNPGNNIKCINLSEEFVIINPYPNPSSGLINLFVVAPHKDHLVLEVYDAVGKFISALYDGGISTGLNKFYFDTSVLSGGTYFCRFTFTTKTFVKPITHVAREK